MAGNRTWISVLQVVFVSCLLSAPVTAVTDNVNQQKTSSTEAECNPEEFEDLEEADLEVSKTKIGLTRPGEITGTFITAATECDISVRIIFDIPAGIEVIGVKGIGSSGSGILRSYFTVPAGVESQRTARADVYATSEGEFTIDATISYWPTGHLEYKKSIPLSLLFTVKDPDTNGDFIFGILTLLFAFALVAPISKIGEDGVDFFRGDSATVSELVSVVGALFGIITTLYLLLQ